MTINLKIEAQLKKNLSELNFFLWEKESGKSHIAYNKYSF